MNELSRSALIGQNNGLAKDGELIIVCPLLRSGLSGFLNTVSNFPSTEPL
jgi:hypothetical protein